LTGFEYNKINKKGEMKMELLMKLMIFLGPAAVVFCVLRALKGTRVRREDDEPIPKDLLGLANSMHQMTNSERPWGLK
jgi:hypothetical protein